MWEVQLWVGKDCKSKVVFPWQRALEHVATLRSSLERARFAFQRCSRYRGLRIYHYANAGETARIILVRA